MIDDCLKEASVSPEQLDAVAVASGPGSFTGLRIGFSTAKGICAAAGCPMLPVPTFESWASGEARRTKAPEGRLYLTMMAAGREELYAACYRRVSGGIVTLTAPRVFRREEIVPFAADIGDHVALGERQDDILQWLPGTADENLAVLKAVQGSPAADVALIGLEKLRAGDTGDVRAAQPMYIKEFSYKLPPKKGA
jgi:tRNA threonylcarbamoyladenosine biosynthesis protein TsaB